MLKPYWRTDLLPSPDPIALLLQRLAPYGLTPGRLGPDPADPWPDFAGFLTVSGPLPPVEEWLVGCRGDVGVTGYLRRNDAPAAVLTELCALLGQFVEQAALQLGCEFSLGGSGRRRARACVEHWQPGETEFTFKPPQFPWARDMVGTIAKAGDLPIAVEETPYGPRIVSTAVTWRHAVGVKCSNTASSATVGLPPEPFEASLARLVRVMAALDQAGPITYEWHPYPRDMETDGLAKQLRIYQQLRELPVPADKYRISLRIVLKSLDVLEAMRPHLTAEGGEWTAGGFRLPDGRGFGVDVAVRKKGYQILVHSKKHAIDREELHELTGLRWR